MPKRLLTAALLLAALPAHAQSDMARWRAEAASVTITRDDWGVAHVKGATDADAVFGMIYAQAEDDFNRIETNYLVSLGRLAEAEGESAIWQDLRQRLFIDPDTLKADYATGPLWLRKLMNAWADGLNYYLATHPAVHPRVLTRFEPWMALSFSEGSIGGDIERAPLGPLEAFYGKREMSVTLPDLGSLAFQEPKGSNGIAIAPSHTRDGHALLLINPHTSFFFRAEQQVTSGEGLNAYGAATWGQFFIYQGFNPQAGWMHTSSGVDNVDEFAETIVANRGHGYSYRYGGKLRPVRMGSVTLAYRTPRGLTRRSFVTFATHHGPIVREADGKWIAFALMNRPVAALEQSFLRTKTHDYASFLKVAALKANSSNNTIFADAKGETALLMPQFMPVRSARFDYRKPVDGSDPATDWHGLHSLASLPHVLNPANGWLYNSNNWPWTSAGADSPKAADYPRYLDQAGENPRGPHAIRVLSARKDFTPQTLMASAFDSYLTAFARLVPGLISAYDNLPDRDPAKLRLAGPAELLRSWNYRWGADSAATSLAVFWGEALWAPSAQPAREAGLSVWDYMAERATDAQKLAALGEAADRLTKDFGSWQVPWGEINRFQRNDGAIVQTFDDARASTAVPFTSAQWGSLASFGARRYPGTKRYYGTSGNSFVAVVEFGPRLRAWAVTAGGESGHPESPHFKDQAERYAGGNLRPVYFYPADLKGHVERAYRPGE